MMEVSSAEGAFASIRACGCSFPASACGHTAPPCAQTPAMGLGPILTQSDLMFANGMANTLFLNKVTV